MARVLTVGAAQLGPIQKAESRTSVVNRMLALVESANDKGCDLIVFTELSLTTFFPRWYMEDQDEVDQWFEAEMPGPDTQALFRRLQRQRHHGGGARCGAGSGGKDGVKGSVV